MLTTILRRGALALAAAGALATLGAASASAATVPAGHGQLDATTRISQRYDSGGNGNWAVDSFKRVLTITYLGKSTDPAMAATPYMYDASVTDTGTFVDIPLAYTPNQGGHDLGLVLKPGQVTGTMAGYGDYGLFYASAKPSRGLVPAALHGLVINSNPAYASATWPELAFPAGTTFSGVNEAVFSYAYNVPQLTVTTVTHGVRHTRVYKAQNWLDAWNNNDGQAPRAGNITGR